MTEIFEQIALPPELRAAARPLSELGVNGLAWSRRDALSVLDHLAGQPIAVLGGDVLVLESDGPRYADSNWHVEPRPGEMLEHFAARSQERAREYIQRYPQGDAESSYVLVLSAKLPPVT